jgi:hypothetical protein
MRLPHDRINVKRVAALKPQALGMDANEGGQLNMYKVEDLVFSLKWFYPF